MYNLNLLRIYRSRIAPPIATTDLSFPKELNIILKEEDMPMV